MAEVNIKVISQEDVSAIFRGRTKSILSLVEKSLKEHTAQHILMPDKISQIFDETTQSRINCMPATILSDKICGVKWISVFPTNAKKGIPNVNGTIILSEINSGLPIALIDGTLCTKVRTAAVGLMAAKYLAPSSVKKVGIIGSGEEARMHFALLKYMYPSITECCVMSRNIASEISFINCFNSIMSDVRFVSCNNDSARCVNNADIIVTAISSQAPILKASDITKGGLYIHVGGWEDEYDVALKANKIVCDDWAATKHRTQTISRMYRLGILKDSNIYANLPELISREKKGRESDDEFIYFNSVGLAYIDIIFANFIYKEANKLNLGQFINLAKSSKTDYNIFMV